jgi:hypothetical protein
VKPEEDVEHTPDRRVAEAERPRDDTQRGPAVASATSAEEEESIDEYMSRLMQRLRSTGTASAPVSSGPSRSELAQSQRQASGTGLAAEAGQPASAISPAVPWPEPAKISPRTAAPEKRDDLSALRALANFSARSDINRHARQTLISNMYSKLVVALVALAAGGGLLWMWKAAWAVEMAYYSASVALIVALYFGVEYAMLTGRLRVSKSGHIDIHWNGLAGNKPATSPVKSSAASDDVAEDSTAEQIPAAGVNPGGNAGAEPEAVDSATNNV